ncbi:MAG: hypothetical protein BWY37_02207 [Firmicutes bacterium ADurb.Bin262]|nr:MAG: hypothetical protein BWY37_02207 [Firmicutes bacterium ADurb.Bin262]
MSNTREPSTTFASPFGSSDAYTSLADSMPLPMVKLTFLAKRLDPSLKRTMISSESWAFLMARIRTALLLTDANENEGPSGPRPSPETANTAMGWLKYSARLCVLLCQSPLCEKMPKEKRLRPNSSRCCEHSQR